jgi:hypothetical protein
MTGKPTVSELGIDLGAQAWQRSGPEHGGIEVAFIRTADTTPPNPPDANAPDPPANALDPLGANAPGPPANAPGPPANRPDPSPPRPAPRPAPQPASPPGRTEWVLLRVTGDPDRRVLVFDRHEWECFLDGARHGEFDDAATQG